MKKINLFIACIMAIIFAVLVFQRCSKEYESKTEDLKNATQFTKQDLQVESKILGFKEKIDYIRENPDSKSGNDPMKIDSAVWYLEATLNYTYGDPENQFIMLYYDTTNYSIDLDANEQVLMDDVSQTYDNMVNHLRTFYQSINAQNKTLVLANLENSGINYSQLQVQLVAVVGNMENGYDPFGDEDWWFYRGLEGKCGAFTGQGIGSDAAEEIQEQIMSSRPIYIPCPHCYIFYTDVETKTVYGDKYDNPDDPPPPDNWLDYLMFYNTEEGGLTNDDCLEPDEMNFYFNGTKTVIYEHETALTSPPNKTFMECNIKGTSSYYQDDNYTTIMHKADIKYGIMHLVITNVINEDLPLSLN